MSSLREFSRKTKLMGSTFEFILLAPHAQGETLLDNCIEEVRRIEDLLTEFSPTSETAYINRGAGGVPVSVSAEVYQIIERSVAISKITQGAFDITANVLKSLYDFKGGRFVFPSNQSIEKIMNRVGYQYIELAQGKVRLQKPGMHIGFGAIGKGYAADCVKKIMVDRGVTSGVVSASGDLIAWGKRLDGSDWKIGISRPTDPKQAMCWIPIKNAALATSGDYEQYFVRDGIRYSHTIHPLTGLPTTGVKSATVITPSAELSDALATALFILGPSVGMDLVDQLKGAYAIMVNDLNEIFFSKKLRVSSPEEIILA